MTLRDTQEPHAALLTAGAVMFGLGIVIATFRNGLWLGCGLVIVGVVLAVIGTVRARRDWARRPSPDQRASRKADRLATAKNRLGSLMGASGTTGLVALAASVLFPRDERWLLAGISGIIFVLAATARLVLERRSDASRPHR